MATRDANMPTFLISTRSREERESQGGFTLIEMVMVLVIIGILGVTLSALLSTGVGAFIAGRDIVDTMSKLRSLQRTHRARAAHSAARSGGHDRFRFSVA